MDGFDAAIEIAKTKYRSQLESLLKKLGTNDPELAKALEGNEQAPIDHSGETDGEAMVPPMADQS